MNLIAKRALGAVLLILGLSACGSSHLVMETTLSALELQAMQTRDFEADTKMAFASVMTVLQDAGYIVESADVATGFITGKSPAKSATTYDLFWGFGKKHGTTRVTAFIEPIGQKYSKIRLNFVAIEVKSNLYGSEARVDTPVEDHEMYVNVFEKIDEAIFIRKAIGAGEVDEDPESDGGLIPPLL